MADGGTPQATLPQKAARGRHKDVRLTQTVTSSASMSRKEDTKVAEEGNANILDTTTPKDTKEASTEELAKVPDQPFRLMDLPLEVRTMIFKELLVMPGPILFKNYVHSVQAERDKASLRAMPILMIYPRPFSGAQMSDINIVESNFIWQGPLLGVFLASKSIYRETVPIYFGTNFFSFESLSRFEDFVSKIGPECRWQLARLKIGYCGKAPTRAIKRLVDCVGLRELELKIHSYSIAFLGDVFPYAPRLHGIKELLKVRGLTKLEVDFSEYRACSYPEYDAEKVKPAVIEQLQVLKQPHDPKKLKRQEKKDFPAKTTRRIVFGSANVVTRAEKRLLDAQQGAPSS